MNPNINTATATPASFEVDPTLPGVSFFGTVRSELAKLRALRTSWWLSAITVGLGAFIAGAVAFSFRYFMSNDPDITMDALELAVQGQAGGYFAMILIGSLGVVAVTTEYSTGAIRSSLTAVPQRPLLLSAKALALALWTAAVAVALILVSHLLTSLIAEPLGLADIADPEIAGLYLSTFASILLTALLGFALGVLLRSSAGGIVVLAVIMFVFQIVLNILYGVTQGAAWVEILVRVEFMHLVDNLTNPFAGEYGSVPAWEPWQAGIGLVIWVAVPLVVGAISFSRRDS
ncbi:ABC transporter permease subunit [Nesterenkonia muleiensis]|uniref:ABC transporter permease subunit n=1 Tax=Nesterenkonia muleiensis TaxID=2282648 RepID=UPI000E740CE7|nr:ABC transporter permease subunit [Nesterenkonia muleiensis]